MKKVHNIFICVLMTIILLGACSSIPKPEQPKSPNIEQQKNEENKTSSNTEQTPNKEATTVTKIKITVNGRTFTATWFDNEPAQQLAQMMPLTISMTELHGNEKYHDLAQGLTGTNNEHPASMQAGDIMLWHTTTIVIFYETFSNAYSGYTRLGTIDDVSELATVLGNKNVEVTFSFVE